MEARSGPTQKHQPGLLADIPRVDAREKVTGQAKYIDSAEKPLI